MFNTFCNIFADVRQPRGLTDFLLKLTLYKYDVIKNIQFKYAFYMNIEYNMSCAQIYFYVKRIYTNNYFIICVFLRA